MERKPHTTRPFMPGYGTLPATTEDALNPVVVEGVAEPLTDPTDLAKLLALENRKYETDYKIDMLDPALNSCFRVRPRWAFGIKHGDFEGSPTRWEFEPPGA